jgi:hypothetical protein
MRDNAVIIVLKEHKSILFTIKKEGTLKWIRKKLFNNKEKVKQTKNNTMI